MNQIVYDRTIAIVDIGAADWWEFFYLEYENGGDLVYFDDLPGISGSKIRIIVTGVSESEAAECGRVIMGIESQLGVTVEGVQSRLQDFSRKERDAFGNLTLVPRRTIRLVDFDFMVEAPQVDRVQRRFTELAARPTLYIGHTELPETFVFGIFTQFSTIINGHTITECSAAIEEF
jgi:hypothetical protein